MPKVRLSHASAVTTDGASNSVARVIAAFAAVYSIWGSTYLAIRFAIETMPPFAMVAVRFLVAGAILYVWMRLRGAARPNLAHWRSALIVGGLLLVAGNGMVVWSEQMLPSSIAALIVAMVPVWMALIDWLRPGGARPRAGVLVGLALGFAGVGMLVFQGHSGGEAISLLGAVGVLIASFSWACGSLYARTAKMPSVPLLGTAMEMLCGGALLVIVSLATGEVGQVHVQAISLRSGLALAYLIVFGSLVGFSAYVWLLRNVPASRVSTYAYVNPVVAVFLGWALAGEELSAQTLLAAAVIVAAVVLVMAANGRGAASAQTTEASAPPTSDAPAEHESALDLEPAPLGGRA